MFKCIFDNKTGVNHYFDTTLDSELFFALKSCDKPDN